MTRGEGGKLSCQRARTMMRSGTGWRKLWTAVEPWNAARMSTTCKDQQHFCDTQNFDFYLACCWKKTSMAGRVEGNACLWRSSASYGGCWIAVGPRVVRRAGPPFLPRRPTHDILIHILPHRLPCLAHVSISRRYSALQQVLDAGTTSKQAIRDSRFPLPLFVPPPFHPSATPPTFPPPRTIAPAHAHTSLLMVQ